MRTKLDGTKRKPRGEFTELRTVGSTLTENGLVGYVLNTQKMKRTMSFAMAVSWVAWNPPVLLVMLDTNGQLSCKKCEPPIPRTP